MERGMDILIVEDSKTQALRLRFALEGRGYMVHHAINGRKALESMRERAPALVISDVVMPEMDGFQLCETAKSDPALASIPIILLTSLSDPTDVIQALQAGADNFITKPYKDETLFGRIDYTLANLALRSGVAREDSGSRIRIAFGGRHYDIDASRIQIVDLLLSIYESAIQKNQELHEANRRIGEALADIKALQANHLRLLETNRDSLLVVDDAKTIHFANPAAKAMFGDNEGLLDQIVPLLPTTPGEAKEMSLPASGGIHLDVDVRVERTDWNGKAMALIVLRDITESVRMRRELQQLSLTDELTGLYNRRGFSLLADRVVEDSRLGGQKLFVIFADLDYMKRINDTWGHKEGDHALKDTAAILTQCFRKEDIIARMGGDEFCVLGVLGDEPDAEDLVLRLEDAIAGFNSLGSRVYRIAMSAGACTFDPAGDESFDEILDQADAHMYAIKKEHHAGWRD